MHPHTRIRVTRSILKSLNFVLSEKEHHFDRSGTLAQAPLILNGTVNNNLMYQYLLQVYPMAFNGDNLSRSTVSGIVWTAICNSLFIFEGTYLTSNFWYDFRVAIMADFKSRRHCGSNAMWRICLSTRTHASDTTTNSCNSLALNNTPDRNFTFMLHCSYTSTGRYTPNHWSYNRQQTAKTYVTNRTTDYLQATDCRQKTVVLILSTSDFPSRIR
jgi:hypothetical protein